MRRLATRIISNHLKKDRLVTFPGDILSHCKSFGWRRFQNPRSKEAYNHNDNQISNTYPHW